MRSSFSRLEGVGNSDRSRLVFPLLLLLLVWSVLWPLFLRYYLMPGAGWANAEIRLSGAFALGVLLALVLHRRGRYLSAAALAVGLLFAAVVASNYAAISGALEPAFNRNDVALLSYLVLPVVISAVLLPPRLVLVVFACSLGAVFAVPVFYPHIGWSALLYGPAMYLATVCGLLLLIFHLLSIQMQRNYARLQSREEQYRSLFEQSPGAIALVSRDGVVEAANQSWLSLFGYEASEVKGLHALAVYANPDDRESLMAKVEREGGLTDEPVRMRRKDGSVIDCLATLAVFKDAVGRTLGYQTVIRDVTEPLRIQEELRLKGELLDLARDGIMLVDPGGELVYVNEATAVLTGYPASTLVGKNIRELNTHEQAELVPTRIGTMLRQGYAEFEAQWVCSDGRRIDVEVRARTIESRGRPLFLSVVRDVSHRRADEAELRLRSELLDAAQDSVFLHDLKGRIVYANASAAQLLDYTPDELLGMEVRSLEASEDAFKFRDRMSELFVRQSLAYETTHVCKDGTLLPVEVRARLIDSGGATYVLSVARDVRERKRADEALKAERDRAQRYLDVAAVIFVALDAAGNITLVNRKGAEVLGVGADELVGRNWFDTCIPEEQRNRVRAVFKSLMSGDLEQPFEYFENDVSTAAGEDSEHSVAQHDAAG